MASPNPGTYYNQLFGVSCGVTSCTAAGGYSDTIGVVSPLAERSAGSTWTTQSVPEPSGGNLLLVGVSCPSRTECIAVGHAGQYSSQTLVAYRWDGARWHQLRLPVPHGSTYSSLNAVSCPSSSSCTAVGAAVISGRGVALAERWAGKNWTAEPVPLPAGADGGLHAISCLPGSSLCTATGGWQSARSSGPQVLAERWNGSAWSLQPTPTLRGTDQAVLWGVSCPSTRSCTAVGVYGDPVHRTSHLVIDEWNGHRWTADSAPEPAGTDGTILSAVSCTAPTTCTAVGSTLRHGSPGLTLAVARHGARWDLQSTPNPDGIFDDFLDGVSCASTTCTAVGRATARAGGYFTLVEQFG